MNNIFLIFTGVVCCFLPLYGQGYSNTMVFGYGGATTPTNDDFGLNILSFTDGSLQLGDNQTGGAFFNDTDAAISDKNGNLLFYFNGIDVFNKNHVVMDNGDTLNPYQAAGYDLPQGAIILPHSSQVNKYYLIHAQEGYALPWGLVMAGIYYSIIDMNQNNGLGKVTLRKKAIVIDTLDYGQLSVVRHGNGRDWWLLAGEAGSNGYYKIIINSTGAQSYEKFHVGQKTILGLGQSCFSPDGLKYVKYGSYGANGFTRYMDIYDFDRCLGQLFNHQHFEVLQYSIGGGIAISPNSRWLYLSLNDALYKYDLWASVVMDTQELIAEYEPFNDPFPTNFFWMFLAPDDKIYIVTTSGSQTLHVIHKPDEPGITCVFEQNAIHLPCNNNSSLPTFANYRLGPLDGSPCDNLGLDNDPVAWWRYEQDTLQRTRIAFRDLSYHDPASWHWDFGDGASSSERHPVHEYVGTGAYEACLTVSNLHGSHTHCKTLYSTVALQDDPALLAAVKVGPNPFSDKIQVSLSAALRSPALRLYDQLGRLVGTASMAYGITEIDTGSLPAGLYFWEVRSTGELLKAGKLVKRR